MTESKNIFAVIDLLTQDYLNVWEDLCRIESPSSSKEGVDAVGNYCIAIAREKGWKVDVLPQPVSGDAVCITLNPDSPAPPVAISGHMDTVHPIGSFGTPTVRRDAEKIYGPGILDCKSGVALGLFVLDVLDRCDFRKRPVMLLLQSDEEVGSRTSNKETINWICAQAKDAVAFFNLENSRKGKAGISRKAIARYQFEIQGKAVHSAHCELGANAVAQAAHIILELEKLKDSNAVTCNCSMISGGTSPNAVPERCSFSADFRFRENEQLDNIRQLLERVSKTEYIPGCSCTYQMISHRLGMPVVQRNLDLLDKVNKILTGAGMTALEPEILNSGSDAAYATAAGIPCLDSVGPSGGSVHSLREYAYLDSLPEAARRIATILYHI